MPELQSTVSALNARLAEYMANMDAEEAEAYRKAANEQAEIEQAMKESKGAWL